MITPVLFRTALALLALATPLLAAIDPEDLTGTYRAEGDGYTARLTIRRTGETYELRWQIRDLEYKGVALRDGQTLAASYSGGGQNGVLLYRIEKDRLVGRYAPQGAGGTPHEEIVTPWGDQPPAQTSAPLAVGSRVAAQWAGSSWYIGTIKRIEGNRYHVLYDDNDEADVNAEQMFPIGAEHLDPGQRVLACWSSAKMYEGEIIDRSGGKVTVKWADGSTPSKVPLDKVALYRAAPAGQPAGTRVAALWNGAYYLATVKSANAGKLHVLYDDQAEADLTERQVLPIAKPEALSIGSRVMACWSSVRMYPGQVIGRTDRTVVVKWDDGSAPSEVLFEKVALLPPEANPAVPRPDGF